MLAKKEMLRMTMTTRELFKRVFGGAAFALTVLLMISCA